MSCVKNTDKTKELVITCATTKFRGVWQMHAKWFIYPQQKSKTILERYTWFCSY